LRALGAILPDTRVGAIASESTQFQMVINLKTAKTLGLEVPSTV
jgi:hypothetical protein